MTRTESGGVTYRGFNNYNRWSDAVTRCKQSDHGGGFLTKIKNLDELKKARVAASIQHHTVDFWVGVKYDQAKNNFIWGDGSIVTRTADFDAIVNRNDQETPGYSKRCMYLTNQNRLAADDCGAHRKYICQIGETDDATTTSK